MRFDADNCHQRFFFSKKFWKELNSWFGGFRKVLKEGGVAGSEGLLLDMV